MSNDNKSKGKVDSGKGNEKGNDGKQEPKPSQSQSKDERINQDLIYKYDNDFVETFRANKPWTQNPRFFKHTKISALAAMKMLKHALLGVETGRKSASGTSFEVMGLCIGKPDGDTIVVMDTIPSTVIGAENGVDMEKVLPYMAMMSDSIELKRAERFVGWYHSHPFDVETYSHCHLSSIDVQTQTGWQNSIPTWVAIVVDPLRSLAKQEPEFGAFRVFPPNFSPQPDECPDGTTMPKESRMVRWGVSAERYYALKISFFMSSLGRRVLDTMSKNSLWIRILASSSVMEPENRQRFSERVRKANDKLTSALNTQALGGRGGFYASAATGRKGGKDDLSQGTLACSELAIEQCKGHCSQMSKDLLFNFLKRINMLDDQKEEKKRRERRTNEKPQKRRIQ